MFGGGLDRLLEMEIGWARIGRGAPPPRAVGGVVAICA
jgi:hypothetical protein